MHGSETSQSLRVRVLALQGKLGTKLEIVSLKLKQQYDYCSESRLSDSAYGLGHHGYFDFRKTKRQHGNSSIRFVSCALYSIMFLGAF